MTDYLHSIDFTKYYFPYLPVTLSNKVHENKCWVNSVLQALKASPSLRNYVFANIRGRSMNDDHSINLVWKDPVMVAFWDSFLCNELRDGKREFIRRPNKKSNFQPGFFGEENHSSTRFCCLDFPWSHKNPECGFDALINDTEVNEMQELIDSINKIDRIFRLSESKVVTTISRGRNGNIAPKVPVHLSQIEGPFILVNPLLPIESGDHRYKQLDQNRSVINNRVKLEPQYYKTCLNESLQQMSDNNEFTLGVDGKILIVVVEVLIQADSVLFLPPEHKNGPSLADIKRVKESSDGFRVANRMVAKPYLHLQNQFYILTSLIKSTVANHFTVSTNGDLKQQWWTIDDASIYPCDSARQLQNERMDAPNCVVFFYEKLELGVLSEAFVTNALIRLETNFNIVSKNEIAIRRNKERGDEMSKELLPYSNSTLSNIIFDVQDDDSAQSDLGLYNMDSYLSQGDPVPREDVTEIDNESTVADGTNVKIRENIGAKISKSKKSSRAVVSQTQELDEDDLSDDEAVGFSLCDDDKDHLVGKSFFTIEGTNTVKGKITKCLKNNKGKIFYKVIYAKENQHDFIHIVELKNLLLNGRNGTIMAHNEKEFILTSVRSSMVNSATKRPQPLDYSFEIKWDNLPYDMFPYNTSMFLADAMQAFLKDPANKINYQSFKRHYNKALKIEWMQYRYCPATTQREEHFKITLGDNTVVIKTMQQALTRFGAKSISTIKLQHDLFSQKSNANRAWFQVDNGNLVVGTRGLDCSEERLIDASTGQLSHIENFKWTLLDCDMWIKLMVLKTSGIYCLLAACLNALMLSHEDCNRLFLCMQSEHDTSGEVNAGSLLFKIQQVCTGPYHMCFERCKVLKTFREVSKMIDSKDFGNVLIVCYKTTNGSTHAICWDLFGKRILDSEIKNSAILTYREFTPTSTIARNIVDSLYTSFDEPCILYIAYWKLRALKRKRLGSI